jgi:hypothetical protein
VQVCQPAWRPQSRPRRTVALDRLVAEAMPLLTADPDARGPVPRFQQALLDVLDTRAPDPTADENEDADAEEPPGRVRDTAQTLEVIAHTAADAAGQLHPVGRVGMPDNTA